MLSRPSLSDPYIQVTPTSLRLSGPFPEKSNRVIRENIQHSDCFLRVAFVEEDKLHFGFDQQYEFEEFVRQRVGTVLKDGLEIGGRRLKFLAYSQSAVRCRHCDDYQH
jgi:RNA-dependent RNA polymerase